MIRLDRYLSSTEISSRKQTRHLLRKGEIFVNNIVIYEGDFLVQDNDLIRCEQKEIIVKEELTILIHKPKGYICSDKDEGGHKSRSRLLEDCPYRSMLHVAGRLDHDTEGLVVATSNGQYAHRLISPKHKLQKVYYIQSKYPLTPEDCLKLSQGVILDDGYKTLPATCIYIDDNSCRLTIYEGKYHQVKRMLMALGNEVSYLKREQFGVWNLEELEMGTWRYVD